MARRRTDIAAAVAGLALMGCASTSRLSALEARIGAIESALGVGASAAAREDEAMARLDEVRAAVRAGRMDDARLGVVGLMQDYQGTQAADMANGMVPELAVIGERAATFEQVRWLQGSGDLSTHKATVVVFWEVWCPYCRRFVPEIQVTLDALAAEGLGVISVTQVSRGTTEQDVLDFAREAGLTFPIGVGDSALSDAYAVGGIPAAAVVKGGEIVWRGHPIDLDRAYLTTLLQ